MGKGRRGENRGGRRQEEEGMDGRGERKRGEKREKGGESLPTVISNHRRLFLGPHSPHNLSCGRRCKGP